MKLNPILEREVRERMRSLRAPFLITVYLGVLGFIVVMAERYGGTDFGGAFLSAGLGRAIYHWLLFFTMVLVCFLVPAFTAGAIASERAGRTFHLLQITLLTPRQIVLGKLAASMAFVTLLILATAPLMSVSFLLGGVTPLDLVRGYAMVLLTALTLGMLGIGLSANLRRPMAATVLTYALMATLTIGSGVAYGAIRLSQARSGVSFNGREPMYTLVLNPFFGTASALGPSGAGFNTTSPFDPIIQLLNRQEFVVVEDGFRAPIPAPLPPGAEIIGKEVAPDGTVRIMTRVDGLQVAPGQASPERPQVLDRKKRVPVWVSTVGWYAVLILLGYRLAVIGVRTPVSGIGFGRRRIALGDG